jgi:hypothetical protein
MTRPIRLTAFWACSGFVTVVRTLRTRWLGLGRNTVPSGSRRGSRLQAERPSRRPRRGRGPHGRRHKPWKPQGAAGRTRPRVPAGCGCGPPCPAGSRGQAPRPRSRRGSGCPGWRSARWGCSEAFGAARRGAGAATGLAGNCSVPIRRSSPPGAVTAKTSSRGPSPQTGRSAAHRFRRGRASPRPPPPPRG